MSEARLPAEFERRTAGHPARCTGRLWVAGAVALLTAGVAAGGVSAQILSSEHRASYLDGGQGQPSLGAAGNRVLATWFGSGYYPNSSVGWGYSLDGGSTWTNGYGLPEVPPFNSANVPAVICLDPSGNSTLATDWGEEQYFHSTSTGAPVWGGPTYSDHFVPGQTVDDSKCLASDPGTGALYEAYVLRYNYAYSVMFIRSLDGGTTWSSPLALSSGYSNGASLALGPNGEIYVVWMDYQQSLVLGCKSGDHGATFGSPFVVGPAFDNPQAVPQGWQVPDGQNERFDPAYAPNLSGPAPNFPVVAVDRSSGPNRGRVYVTWAERADGVTGPATVSLGESETNDTPGLANVIPINSDISGFLPSDEFGNFDVDYFAFDGAAGETVSLGGSLSVNSPNGSSGAAGVSLEAQAADGSLHDLLDFVIGGGTVVVPPAIVTLPQTGRYYLVIGNGGDQYSSNYVLSLREYTPSAGSAARDMRDVVLTSSGDGGASWGAKRRVNHDPPGADQSMPAVAVDGQGLVYVAWYDRRGYALGDSVNSYASVSGDGGQTFGTDVRLSSAPSFWQVEFDPTTFSWVGAYVGDRIALAGSDAYAIAAWTDYRAGADASRVYTATIAGGVVAVEAISDLGAEVTAGGVRVHWLVNSTRGVAAVRVYRTNLADGIELALGDADLLPQSDGEASYLDTTAQPGQRYTYRLSVRDASGTHWLGPVEVETPAAITALAWRGAEPNPFAAATDVTLAVPASGAGEVRIYDVQGHEVRTLAAGRIEAGERRLHWDGRDASGQAVAPGIYFLAAQLNGASARLKLARVR